MTNDDLTNKAFNITITVMDNVEVSSLFIKGNNINKSVAINNKTGSTTIRVDENCALEITAIDSVGNKAVETYEVTNIYKATSNITDNYVGLVNGDISEYAIGSTTFTVSSDIKNDKYLNLGSWKIESTQREVSSVVSNSGTSIEVTVYENGTYNFTFTDIWGNVSGPYSVTVNNVLSEELNYKLLYLVPLDEYKAKNIVGDVQNVVTVDTVKYRNELINKGYSDYNKFVPIEKSIQNSEKYENVFAYMELLEDSRFVYNFEDYTKTGYEIFKDDITGNDTKVLFKFSSEKNKVSFYYRNVNNTLASVKASFDVNSNDKVPVISTLLETSEVTNEDVRVIVKVADGYFFDNKEYYQYSEDGVVKNYYDEFKWISSESTFDNIVYLDEDTYADETNRKAFVITFKKNATVRIWAKNNNDDFVSKLVNVGNIDKENPIVTVSSYDDKFVYDKLTIEAYTNEIFLSANDLVELLKTLYPDRIEAIDSLDIPNNYTISNNKHYAYMTFKANTTDETRDLFKFYACDYASNFGSSEFININNFYSASENTQFIYAYLDESETFVTITKEELYDMRTNKNITIQVTTKDANGVLYQGGQFFSSNNPNCDVDEPYSLTQVISESGIYTYCVIDSYGNKVYDALDLTDVINKEIPELTYNVTKNTNGQPTTQNIDYTISSNKIGKFEIKNKNGNMIYSSETNETSISFNLSQNGKYSVLFTDIYGNEVWDIIEVTDIYGTAYSPTITVSGIRNTATNENVNVLANVENGNFTDVLYLDNGEYISLIDSNGFKTHEAIEISTTEKGLAFVFKDNLTIKVVAKNYYGNGEVSEEISISCIDKTKPNNANVQYNVSKDGFIEINFIDTGDDGFGSKEVYYTISQPTALDSRQGSTRLNQAVTFSDISATKVPNKNTSFNWKDSQWSDTNSDGKVSEDEVTNSFTLTYYVVDYAGNRSDVSEITIYIDNTSVNEFMSLYRDLTSRLTTIKAIKDDTERQTQLEGFVSENSFFLDAYEEEIENYANTMQKTFVQDKIKTLRMLMSSSTNSSDEVIALINEYFNRLSQDITDNGFMDELQVLINSLDDKSKRESYQSRYDYYKNKIDGLFVDSTSVEFNYTDDKGNWLNPLSGYVVYSTKTGKIYGTYNSNGEFEKGEVNRNYYFTSNGTKINLDITGNTYVDGNGNTVSTIDGLISPNAGYYDNKGEIVQHRPAKGFYDFQGKWHSREGLKEVKDPTTGETGEGGESGNDNPGTGDDPSVNPNPNQGDTKVYPTSITLAKQELTMYVGDVYLMSYTLAPSNVTEKDITWTSTNSKVVRVTNGYIIANGEGTGDIIAKTSNGLSAIVSVTVDKASSANVDNEPEQVTSVSSKLPKYPTIDETYPNKPSEEESGSGVAKYTHQKIGSTNYAAMTLNDAMTNDFRVIYGDGYDDIFISDATNVGSGVIEKASKNNLSITIGNDSTRLTLSNTDNVGRISTFGLSGNSGNATVSINGQNNLGNSSKLTLVGAPDKVVYYNGNIVSSIYDNSEGAYIVTNPMNGTYSIGDRPTSIYTDLDNYDITVDTTGKLSYADVIVACYNCLQSDNFGQLFSNIEESSSVYRQASVLQKHGILGSNPNISTFDNISGKEAYDMLYQTLANKTSEDLNYEPELFSQSSITLDDLNNMVRNITVINY